MSFAILTDSSANLPAEYVEEHGLGVLPFSYTIDGKERLCEGENAIGDAAFYTRLRSASEISTSLVSPQRYADAFELCLREGLDVLYIGMSSGISGSYHGSTVAAGLLREKWPDREIVTFDTRGASLGEGLQVMRAVELRAAGTSLEETVRELAALRHAMRQVFTVDDLMSLRRGGRISSMTAVLGAVLQVKPILFGTDEGKIVMAGRVRGRKHSIRALVEDFAAHVVAPTEQTVGIAHAGCAVDAARLAGLLREKAPGVEILIVNYEPVTGSHVGPGALALFYRGTSREMPSVGSI